MILLNLAYYIKVCLLNTKIKHGKSKNWNSKISNAAVLTLVLQKNWAQPLKFLMFTVRFLFRNHPSKPGISRIVKIGGNPEYLP